MEKPIVRPFVEKRANILSGEVFAVGFIFDSPELAEGETIASANAEVVPVAVGGLAIDSVNYTDNEVSVVISGGEDGEEYQLFVQAKTSAGQTLVGNMLVRIIY